MECRGKTDQTSVERLQLPSFGLGLTHGKLVHPRLNHPVQPLHSGIAVGVGAVVAGPEMGQGCDHFHRGRRRGQCLGRTLVDVVVVFERLVLRLPLLDLVLGDEIQDGTFVAGRPRSGSFLPFLEQDEILLDVRWPVHVEIPSEGSHRGRRFRRHDFAVHRRSFRPGQDFVFRLSPTPAVHFRRRPEVGPVPRPQIQPEVLLLGEPRQGRSPVQRQSGIHPPEGFRIVGVDQLLEQLGFRRLGEPLQSAAFQSELTQPVAAQPGPHDLDDLTAEQIEVLDELPVGPGFALERFPQGFQLCVELPVGELYVSSALGVITSCLHQQGREELPGPGR